MTAPYLPCQSAFLVPSLFRRCQGGRGVSMGLGHVGVVSGAAVQAGLLLTLQ